jgi:predicted component of type VI protein secretion system
MRRIYTVAVLALTLTLVGCGTSEQAKDAIRTNIAIAEKARDNPPPDNLMAVYLKQNAQAWLEVGKITGAIPKE